MQATKCCTRWPYSTCQHTGGELNSPAEPHSQAHKIWDPSFSMCSRASAVLWLRRE